MSNGNEMTASKPQRDIVPVHDFQNPLMDTDKFNHLWRIATAFAKSDMVPAQFRGKIENCFVALQFAMRANLDPFGFLQKCYVIQGRPGIEATLAIALLQNSGMVRGTVQYVFDGEKDDYGCTAWVIDARTGEEVFGPKVNWRLVKAEGWDKKAGSKWKTMPDMMFRYRAAMWLIRSNYPGVVLGLSSKDELDDTADEQSVITVKAPKTLTDLVERHTEVDTSDADESVESEEDAEKEEDVATEEDIQHPHGGSLFNASQEYE